MLGSATVNIDRVSQPFLQASGAASRRAFVPVAFSALPLLLGCGSDRTEVAHWDLAVQSPDADLMSVGGTSESDVWMVGASDGSGPLALHYDGVAWRREDGRWTLVA